jgi:hypothetical protein
MTYHTINDKTITVFLGDNLESFAVSRNSEAYPKLVEALSVQPNDEGQIRKILSVFDTTDLHIINPADIGRITVSRRSVMYDGTPVNSALASRMLDIQQAGLPLDPWIKFANNVYANPADYAREELYLWVAKGDLPITEDGHFLAYKKVDDNFKDIYTGTMDNSPGQIVEMPGGRQAVDTVRDNTCSVGLHFCSKEYLPSFGASRSSKVVIVKVNPADVVSIPSDYDNSKGRTWRYEVLSEFKENPKTKSWTPIVASDGADVFRFNPLGFDQNGYDMDGFDSEGYDSDGFDSEGYDEDGFDSAGYDDDGLNSEERDRNGYDANGYDESGFDPEGYDSGGFNSEGYDSDGYDEWGYDEEGYDIDGYDADGDA